MNSRRLIRVPYLDAETSLSDDLAHSALAEAAVTIGVPRLVGRGGPAGVREGR